MKQNATIKSIADRLGVSISTVSRALQGNKKIGLKTREAVNSLASQLNYVPNPVALNLQQCRTNTIGLVVPTLLEEFFGHIVTVTEDSARQMGFKLLVTQSQNSMEKEKEIIDHFIKNRVDGLLISLSSETNDYSHLTKLEKHGIPAVYFDRIPRNFPADVVKSEITDCTQQAITYLFENNITKIALLNGPTNLLVADERLNGYLQGMQLHNLLTTPKYIKSTDLSESDTIQKMEEFFSLKSDAPQAILCFNDYVLLQATKACKKHGIVPHKDIHFVSFANTSFTQYLDPKPLISIEQFPTEMGLQSATILLDKIKDKTRRTFEEITIPTKLIFNKTENLNL